jgi:hypothetical protein
MAVAVETVRKGARAMPLVNSPQIPAISICQEIRRHLESRRDQVCQEITNHPTPIPACDVHFNRLLEERTKIFQELGRLDQLQGDVQARKQDIASLEDFINTSEAVDAEDRYKLGTALRNSQERKCGSN